MTDIFLQVLMRHHWIIMQASSKASLRDRLCILVELISSASVRFVDLGRLPNRALSLIYTPRSTERLIL